MTMRLRSLLLPVLGLAAAGASGCTLFWDFSRSDTGLAPGDIEGETRIQLNDSPLPYAFVVPGGSSRTTRSGREGRFIVRGLPQGSWWVDFRDDANGDGQAERTARRAVRLVPFVNTAGEEEVPWILLGDVFLGGTAKVSGQVSFDPAVGDAPEVIAVRSADLPGDGDASLLVQLGIEARAQVRPDGSFELPPLAESLVDNDLTLLAVQTTTGGGLQVSEATAVTARADQPVSDLSLSLAALDDIEETATLIIQPAPSGPVEVVGVWAGTNPHPSSFNADTDVAFTVEATADGNQLPVTVPAGRPFDVYVRAGTSRGTLFEQIVLPGSSPRLGPLELTAADLACRPFPGEAPDLEADRDCDHDGAPGLPLPIDASGVPTLDIALWQACAATCVEQFGVSGAGATCRVEGTDWDCDDDGDGQPDVTEPPACYRPGGGGDRDGDGLCDPQDPFPLCPGSEYRPECDEWTPPGVWPDFDDVVEPDGGVDGGPGPDPVLPPIPGLRDSVVGGPLGVRAGGEHTCYITLDQTVECLGRNIDGELGNGVLGQASALGLVVKKADDTDLAPALAVALGQHHSCAIVDDSGAPDATSGTVYCWGANAAGQLGLGAADANRIRAEPVLVVPNTVTSIAAGGAHTCAVTDEGDLYCWGDPGQGRLGLDDDGSGANPTPVRVEIGSSVHWRSVTAGSDFTCASTDRGEVYCAGNNDRGQLGQGSAGTPPSSATFVRVPGLSFPVATLDAGAEHICVTGAGSLVCWGDNTSGKVDADPPPGGPDWHASPALPAGVLDDRVACAVSAGDEHSCAVLDAIPAEGGELCPVGSAERVIACWGDNTFSQLGAAGAGVQFVGLPSSVVDVTAGGAHTCALLDDGTLSCWGLDSQQQVGVADLPRDGPAVVTDPVIPDVPFLRVWTGSSSSDPFAAANWNPMGSPRDFDRLRVDPGTPNTFQLPVGAELIAGSLRLTAGAQASLAADSSLRMGWALVAPDGALDIGPNVTLTVGGGPTSQVQLGAAPGPSPILLLKLDGTVNVDVARAVEEVRVEGASPAMDIDLSAASLARLTLATAVVLDFGGAQTSNVALHLPPPEASGAVELDELVFDGVADPPFALAVTHGGVPVEVHPASLTVLPGAHSIELGPDITLVVDGDLDLSSLAVRPGSMRLASSSSFHVPELTGDLTIDTGAEVRLGGPLQARDLDLWGVLKPYEHDVTLSGTFHNHPGAGSGDGRFVGHLGTLTADEVIVGANLKAPTRLEARRRFEIQNEEGWDHNRGDVVLGGLGGTTDLILLGGISFWNLSVDDPGGALVITAGSSVNVARLLTLEGTPGAPLSVRSDSPGSLVSLSPSGPRDVRHVAFEDVENAFSLPVVDPDGTVTTNGTTGFAAECGNAIVEPGEECDSATLPSVYCSASCTTQPGTGVVRTWTGAAGDGSWTNPGNWSGNVVPSPGEVARIDGADNINAGPLNNGALVETLPTYTGTFTITGSALAGSFLSRLSHRGGTLRLTSGGTAAGISIGSVNADGFVQIDAPIIVEFNVTLSLAGTVGITEGMLAAAGGSSVALVGTPSGAVRAPWLEVDDLVINPESFDIQLFGPLHARGDLTFYTGLGQANGPVLTPITVDGTLTRAISVRAGGGPAGSNLELWARGDVYINCGFDCGLNGDLHLDAPVGATPSFVSNGYASVAGLFVHQGDWTFGEGVNGKNIYLGTLQMRGGTARADPVGDFDTNELAVLGGELSLPVLNIYPWSYLQTGGTADFTGSWWGDVWTVEVERGSFRAPINMGPGELSIAEGVDFYHACGVVHSYEEGGPPDDYFDIRGHELYSLQIYDRGQAFVEFAPGSEVTVVRDLFMEGGGNEITNADPSDPFLLRGTGTNLVDGFARVVGAADPSPYPLTTNSSGMDLSGAPGWQVPLTCGDGTFDPAIERCEYTGVGGGNSCTATCTVPLGHTCDPLTGICSFNATAACGNKILEENETCDQGRECADGSGIDCTEDPGLCPGGVTDCQVKTGTGCTSTCQEDTSSCFYCAGCPSVCYDIPC